MRDGGFWGRGWERREETGHEMGDFLWQSPTLASWEMAGAETAHTGMREVYSTWQTWRPQASSCSGSHTQGPYTCTLSLLGHEHKCWRSTDICRNHSSNSRQHVLLGARPQEQPVAVEEILRAVAADGALCVS